MRKIYLTILILVTVGCVIGGTVTHAVGFAAKAGKLLDFADDASREAGEGYEDVGYDASAWSSIELSAATADVKICSGDTFGVKWKGPDAAAPTIRVDGTKLVVDQDTDVNDILHSGRADGKLTVTIPGGQLMEKVSLKLSVGNCDIDGMQAVSLEIEMNAGNIKIEESVIDDLKIDNNMGNTEVEEIAAKNVQIESNMGNIEVESVSGFESITLKNDVGNIEAKLDQKLSEIICDLNTSLGDVKLNDKKGKNHIVTGSGSAKLTASASLGNIKVKTDD